MVELNCGGNEGAGEFIDIVADERVVFTFGWSEPGHPIPAGSTEVEISLTPQGEDTLVRLTHRGLPEDAVSDHEDGWGFYLARLGGAHARRDARSRSARLASQHWRGHGRRFTERFAGVVARTREGRGLHVAQTKATAAIGEIVELPGLPVARDR